jgi:hypothetical protein
MSECSNPIQESSGGDAGRRPSSTRNALLREGIMPVTSQNPFGTPSHKPRTNSLYKATDQMKLFESISEIRQRSAKRSSVSIANASASDAIKWEDNFLDKADW